MLKGKKLYEAAREFVDESVTPALAEDADGDPKDELLAQAAGFGIAIVIDIAESLHKIATKVG